jgi:hypothetical protein
MSATHASSLAAGLLRIGITEFDLPFNKPYASGIDGGGRCSRLYAAKREGTSLSVWHTAAKLSKERAQDPDKTGAELKPVTRPSATLPQSRAQVRSDNVVLSSPLCLRQQHLVLAGQHSIPVDEELKC